jgi:hypothetical protein
MLVYGNDIEKVGKHLGANYWTISLRCKKMGLHGKGRAHLRKFTDADFMDMFNQLHGDQLELSIHFGCGRTTIKNALKRLGITTRRQNRK